MQVVEADPEKLSCWLTFPVEGTVAEQLTEHEVDPTVTVPVLLQVPVPDVAVNVHVKVPEVV